MNFGDGPQCFEIAQRILYRAAKEAINRYLESLKPELAWKRPISAKPYLLELSINHLE
jgi:hypothetical protein